MDFTVETKLSSVKNENFQGCLFTYLGNIFRDFLAVLNYIQWPLQAIKFISKFTRLIIDFIEILPW